MEKRMFVDVMGGSGVEEVEGGLGMVVDGEGAKGSPNR